MFSHRRASNQNRKKIDSNVEGHKAFKKKRQMQRWKQSRTSRNRITDQSIKKVDDGEREREHLFCLTACLLNEIWLMVLNIMF